jgi:hypothetical protein
MKRDGRYELYYYKRSAAETLLASSLRMRNKMELKRDLHTNNKHCICILQLCDRKKHHKRHSLRAMTTSRSAKEIPRYMGGPFDSQLFV